MSRKLFTVYWSLFSDRVLPLFLVVCISWLSTNFVQGAEIDGCKGKPALSVGKVGGHVAFAVSDKEQQFQRLCDSYLDFVFKFSPHHATSSGIHTYDDKLVDYSAENVQNRIAELKKLLKAFEELDFDQLSRDSQIDWNLVVGDINSQLLDLTEVQNWKKNPDMYSSAATEGVFVLIQRDFAPIEERLKSVIAREEQIPQSLENGKKNLDLQLVPEIYTKVALEQLPGSIDFFKTTLPDYFKKVKDKELKARFESSNREAVDALTAYQGYLTEKVSGKCKGDFALGADLYTRKLLHEEFVSEPLDSLLARGKEELSRLQKEFKECARQIDSSGDPVKIFTSISSDHPKPDQLITGVKSVLDDIREFCINKPVCTIPGEERPLVEETPPFNRALSFASMDTPGPFEKKAKEAYYYVTLPERNWSKEKTEEHMRSFSKQDLLNTSVHEAYPGHYVQFLWVNKAPSKVRKVLGCMSNAEGWAHYTEKMMVDEGFSGNDPKLRITQVHDALLRVCRYIVGISMHTKGMTMDEGIKVFVDEGFQEKANGERETKRGTMDPTYLVYTMGKLDILALRDDYRKKKGESFSIRDFHDAFLKEGYPPLSMVRAQLLDLPVTKYSNTGTSR